MGIRPTNVAPVAHRPSYHSHEVFTEKIAKGRNSFLSELDDILPLKNDKKKNTDSFYFLKIYFCFIHTWLKNFFFFFYQHPE